MSQWPYNTAAWKRLRRVKLTENALCEPCLDIGVLTFATVVDHKKPVSSGGDPFPSLDGLCSMCASCHNRKSQGEQHGKPFVNEAIGLDGWPVDPNHPVYRRRAGGK
jgi:5-methylcytosine-specific restriction enzyme A